MTIELELISSHIGRRAAILTVKQECDLVRTDSPAISWNDVTQNTPDKTQPEKWYRFVNEGYVKEIDIRKVANKIQTGTEIIGLRGSFDYLGLTTEGQRSLQAQIIE